ncbi:hypothetical protein [uncultured Arcticibacterium sp.]
MEGFREELERSKELGIVASGTRMTTEFAVFLKEFNKYTGH